MTDLTLEQCLDRLRELAPEVFYKGGSYRVQYSAGIKAREFETALQWDRIVRDALEDFCDSKGWESQLSSSKSGVWAVIWNGAFETAQHADSRVLALARAVVMALGAK
jgi:hypothetical protein